MEKNTIENKLQVIAASLIIAGVMLTVGVIAIDLSDQDQGSTMENNVGELEPDINITDEERSSISHGVRNILENASQDSDDSFEPIKANYSEIDKDTIDYLKVEIVVDEDQKRSSTSIIKKYGGNVTRAQGNIIKANVPIVSIPQIAGSESIQIIREPPEPEPLSEPVNID